MGSAIIIGFGNIARGAHLPSLLHFGFQDIDIVDIEETHWGGRYLGKEIPEEGDYDVALVASPPKFHKEHTLSALLIARKVLCEKPPALNAPQTKAMLDTARKLDRSLLFGFHNVFRDSWLVFKSLISSSGGRIIKLSAEYRRRDGVPDKDWFKRPIDEGGGVLLDLGSHMLSLVYDLLSPQVNLKVHSVTAEYLSGGADSLVRAQCQLGDTTVDLYVAWRDETCNLNDMAAVTADLENGVRYQWFTHAGWRFEIHKDGQLIQVIHDRNPYIEEWKYLLESERVLDMRALWVMKAIDAIKAKMQKGK